MTRQQVPKGKRRSIYLGLAVVFVVVTIGLVGVALASERFLASTSIGGGGESSSFTPASVISLGFSAASLVVAIVFGILSLRATQPRKDS
jgi:hypothetical protein